VNRQPDGSTPDPAPEPAPVWVVAVVPARDSAGTVAATVAALQGLDELNEVLVVDDGSTDDTAAAALDAGATVLRLPHNVGKGGAVAAGLEASPHADVYLLVDADVGATAASVAGLLQPVLDDDADMTIGVLPAAGRRGGFGLVRDFAARGIRRATGFVAKAPLSGQRAVRASLLRNLELAARFGLEVGLTIDAARRGARVREVPVEMEHRHTGRRLSGFAHRARQGIDVSRALWPRVTSRNLRLVLIAMTVLVVLVAVVWSGTRWQPSAAAPEARPGKVVLFGMPGLSWGDIGIGALTNLDRLTDEGAVAALSAPSLGTPSVTEGYAALGAGSRVRAGDSAALASDVGGRVVVTDAEAVRSEAGRHTPTEPGALGDALHQAGRRTAVVGNADTAGNLFPEEVPAELRPTAVALMDRGGVVDAGTVSPDLLTDAPRAPFGHRADPEAMVAATKRALADADVVLVDPGDLSRVAAVKELDPIRSFAARLRSDALRDTDALLGRIRAALPSDALLLVVSVSPPGSQARLTPIVVAGPGVPHGQLYSPSTKRAGLVALSDLAPTVLDALGADVPAAMVGRPVHYRAGATGIDRLQRLDRATEHRQSLYFPLTLAFIAFQGAVYGLIAVALSAGRGGGRASRSDRAARARARNWWAVLRLAAVAIAAYPLATFLFRALPFGPDAGAGGVVVLLAIDGAIVALAARARRHRLAPLGWVLGATVALLIVDVATGARLQVASLMGYSPEAVARYYGIGNPTFAILGATTLLATAIHLHAAPRRDEALLSVAGTLLVVLVLDGLPFLGDDVGGIVTLTPIFAVALWAFSGRRVTWRVVLVALGVAVLALAAAVAVDLLRAPDDRTHLGRVVAGTWEHGESNLATTIARKVDANFRVLRTSVWAWAVPVTAAFLLWLLVWRRRWTTLLPARSALRVGVVAALAAGLCGFLANDSGVVVTALALTYVGPFLGFLALVRTGCEPVLLGPGGPHPRPPRALHTTS
jgi:hypothetical protein